MAPPMEQQAHNTLIFVGTQILKPERFPAQDTPQSIGRLGAMRLGKLRGIDAIEPDL